MAAAIQEPPLSDVLVDFVSLMSTVGAVGTGGAGSASSSVGTRSGIVRNVSSPPPPAAQVDIALVSGCVCSGSTFDAGAETTTGGALPPVREMPAGLSASYRRPASRIASTKARAVW
jgi:hypothetical protein